MAVWPFARRLASLSLKTKYLQPNAQIGAENLFSVRRRYLSQGVDQSRSPPDFGLFFDIDGVIVRGKKLLPHAKEAFRLLTDKDGKFLIPSIFVTNAGNVMRHQKASQLSKWIDAQVEPEQVVMSHSPLKMFYQFLDRPVLVCGQGKTKEIAQNLGYKNVTTIETLRHSFPRLDQVDHKRRMSAPCAFEEYFPRIEAVILFGEPVRWETYLQLIVDVLITNGHPSEAPTSIPYPHIPVLACNMDLMWMSDACMPRFAHGAFLHCLECLYHKITGYELKYTALVGKPSELTYMHSEHVLLEQGRKLGLPGIRRMYCIGDNPDVDIFGANLYHRYLQKRLAKKKKQQQQQSTQLQSAGGLSHSLDDSNGEFSDPDHEAESCESVLVYTGVYSRNRDYNQDKKFLLDHTHRDFIMDAELKKPSMACNDVLEAVEAIFEKEGVS